MIHHASDVRECSATYGGLNYVEQDGKDGLCRYAPHWSRCHCADAVAQATRAERERLRPWMTHQSGCATWTLQTEEFCTCKLAEALRRAPTEPPPVTGFCFLP